jgi:uncharacterized protein (TIGR00251 family)
MAQDGWLTCRPDGVRLSVKVTPRASRAGVQGVEVYGGRAWLAVKVAAPAEGGKANAATIKLLAKRCGVAASALSLVSGAAGRRKVLDVRGEADLLLQRLHALARPDKDHP